MIFSIMCYKYTEYTEHYDAKLVGLTEPQCGTQCTNTYNCIGFGYKPIDSNCYLSKTSILGEPLDSVYENEYSKLDRRCNKINPIRDIDNITDQTMTQNSVYVCSDGENNISTQFQYANLGGSSLESVTSEHLPPTQVRYNISNIDWPGQDSQDSQYSQDSQDIRDDIYPTKDNSLDPGDIRANQNQKYGFIESDKEFLGQYMLAHQCVVNVPFYDCLKFCENNHNCAGTEWNKALIKSDGKNNYLYENVCCPKGVIKKIIPRRDQFNRGNFYVKKDLQDIMGRDNVVLSKADFSRIPPMNNKFRLTMTSTDPPDYNDPEQQNISNVRGVMGGGNVSFYDIRK